MVRISPSWRKCNRPVSMATVKVVKDEKFCSDGQIMKTIQFRLSQNVVKVTETAHERQSDCFLDNQNKKFAFTV